MPQDPPMQTRAERRPIAARSSHWAGRLASWLSSTAITPNQISLISILWAGLGAVLILRGAAWQAWIGAAACVQLRLLCNLLDGMVAVEGGKSTPAGALYNEFPDRVADSLLLVALGYGAGIAWLGWAAALLAALTAYVRVFGGALGLPQDFSGIMAKQRRMALLTFALLAQAVEAQFGDSRYSLALAALLIAAGSLVTCLTRGRAIARRLEAR